MEHWERRRLLQGQPACVWRSTGRVPGRAPRTSGSTQASMAAASGLLRTWMGISSNTSFHATPVSRSFSLVRLPSL